MDEVEIIPVSDGAWLAAAALLFREYQESLMHMPTFCASLSHQGFEEELSALPGKYAAPAGRIIIARVSGEPAGVIALRPIAPGVCEMKRMFVRPQYRGRHVGRLLAQRLIAEARAIGYREMKLDTEPSMEAAVGLYRSLGFVNIDRYNEDPVPCTMFMGLRL